MGAGGGEQAQLCQHNPHHSGCRNDASKPSEDSKKFKELMTMLRVVFAGRGSFSCFPKESPMNCSRYSMRSVNGMWPA